MTIIADFQSRISPALVALAQFISVSIIVPASLGPCSVYSAHVAATGARFAIPEIDFGPCFGTRFLFPLTKGTHGFTPFSEEIAFRELLAA
jgi:hypothetical protein